MSSNLIDMEKKILNQYKNSNEEDKQSIAHLITDKEHLIQELEKTRTKLEYLTEQYYYLTSENDYLKSENTHLKSENTHLRREIVNIQTINEFVYNSPQKTGENKSKKKRTRKKK